MTREEAIVHIKDVICENNTIKPNIVVFEREKEALYMAIKALEQDPEWIPVSERLPEDGGNYLVTIAFDLGDKEPVREVKKDYFCILSKKWLYEEKNVVAWMPLPKSFEPKESEEEA